MHKQSRQFQNVKFHINFNFLQSKPVDSKANDICDRISGRTQPLTWKYRMATFTSFIF